MTLVRDGWFWRVFIFSSCIAKTSADDTGIIAHYNNTSGTHQMDAKHPNWDSHIKELEHLLEVDLAQMERDAHVTVDNQQQANRTLSEDLMHIRHDIDRLIASIKDVEDELGKTKREIDVEERNIHQMSAQMETERFLDGLHRGKLAVKVDYVSGELISKQQMQSRKNLRTTKTKHSRFNTTSIAQTKAKNSTTPVISLETDTSLSYTSYATITSALDDVVAAGAQRVSTDDDQLLIHQKLTSETVRQHIESHPGIKSRIMEEMEFLKSGHDPAVLKFDAHLMLNIVKLAMTASLFGLGAVFLKLPPTAGFLLGGMLIGPSCFDLLGEIHQVQTLAQFGAIFLLFEQGLLYAQTYSDDPFSSPFAVALDEDEAFIVPVVTPSPRIDSNMHSRFSPNRSRRSLLPQTDIPQNPSFLDVDDGHDPTIIGFIILTLLVFVGLSVVFFTQVADTVVEAIMVSSTIAVCSTTIVSETLAAAHIADTVWGIGVLKMISTHDLFMVPLLALPELLSSLVKSNDSIDDDTFNSSALWGITSIFGKLVLVGVFLKGSTFVATHIIRAAITADGHLRSVKGELFTLSVVAYALMIATVSEELSMSIEAGAVLAGIALFKSSYVSKVISSIQPITSVFGGMYLTSLGMIISPAFVLEEAGSIIKLVFLIGVFKLALVSVSLHRFFGYGMNPSIAVGSAMAQISEVSLLVLAKSQRMGLIPRKTYLLLIPTTFIMLSLAPFSASMLRQLPRVHHHESTEDIQLQHCFLKYLQVLRRSSGKKRRAANLCMFSRTDGAAPGTSK